MKKSIIASALALSIVGLVGCAEEAKASDAKVYGYIEQSISTDGAKNINDDNNIGISVSESLNEAGDTAFAKVEFGVDDETNAITNRETYVGVTMNDITAQVGRQKNLRKSMANGVDAFYGESFSVAGAGRTDDMVVVKGEFAGVTVAASTQLDGTANADEVGETRELAASVEVQGVSLTAVQSKVGDADAVLTVAAGVNVAGMDLAVAHEPDATNKTTTGVASIDVGSNTVRGGYSYVDGADNTYIVEGAHNFSKSTSVFVNYSKAENADAATSVGIAMAF
jgi:hypothetical protein